MKHDERIQHYLIAMKQAADEMAKRAKERRDKRRQLIADIKNQNMNLEILSQREEIKTQVRINNNIIELLEENEK